MLPHTDFDIAPQEACAVLFPDSPSVMYKESNEHVVYKQHAGLQVRFLIGLIRKVTGVTIAAFFGDGSRSTYSGSKIAMPWHNSGGFAHNFRKYRMRLASLLVIFSVFVVHKDCKVGALLFPAAVCAAASSCMCGLLCAALRSEG